MFNPLKNEKDAIWCTSFVALALLVCNLYLYWIEEPSGDYRLLAKYVPIIRASACGIYILGALWKGRKFMRYFFPIYALVILYWNRYFNYTSFFIIVVCFHLNNRDGRWMFPIYLADLIIALLINSNMTPAHALIHLFGCLGILIIYIMFFYNMPEPIEANETEKYILDGLAEGKQQKELVKRGLSKTTISTIISTLRKKYGCASNEELAKRWARQNGIDSGQFGSAGIDTEPVHRSK